MYLMLKKNGVLFCVCVKVSFLKVRFSAIFIGLREILVVSVVQCVSLICFSIKGETSTSGSWNLTLELEDFLEVTAWGSWSEGYDLWGFSGPVGVMPPAPLAEPAGTGTSFEGGMGPPGAPGVPAIRGEAWCRWLLSVKSGH